MIGLIVMKAGKLIIYTIGHSTHPINEFILRLQSFHVKLLVDIRRYPGSRKYPAYNKSNLETVFPKIGIRYEHIEELGGRRKVLPNSKNNRWLKDTFKGYADYMETKEFAEVIHRLQTLAADKTTAIMCAEAVWWRCHRSMVADYLKAKGWTVLHIMAKDKVQEHPYTQAAQIRNGNLVYFDN